jgi:hypothetical protein
MKRIVVLAGLLILTGTAHAQAVGSPTGILNGAGSINSAGSYGSGGGINGAGSVNGPSASPAVASAPGAVADRNVNQSSKNPGEYVPSKFTNYGEAVALGEIESGMRPLTVAEAARMAQQQKKNGNTKTVIVLEKDGDGKLAIAPAAKK